MRNFLATLSPYTHAPNFTFPFCVRSRARSCVSSSFYNTCLFTGESRVLGNYLANTEQIQNEVISSYIASRINCRVAECFLAKLRWYLIEQIDQESKVWSALAFRAGYYANIYKNFPLPIHACVQECAFVCARPPECAHV